MRSPIYIWSKHYKMHFCMGLQMLTWGPGFKKIYLGPTFRAETCTEVDLIVCDSCALICAHVTVSHSHKASCALCILGMPTVNN